MKSQEVLPRERSDSKMLSKASNWPKDCNSKLIVFRVNLRQQEGVLASHYKIVADVVLWKLFLHFHMLFRPRTLELHGAYPYWLMGTTRVYLSSTGPYSIIMNLKMMPKPLAYQKNMQKACSNLPLFEECFYRQLLLFSSNEFSWYMVTRRTPVVPASRQCYCNQG